MVYRPRPRQLPRSAVASRADPRIPSPPDLLKGPIGGAWLFMAVPDACVAGLQPDNGRARSLRSGATARVQQGLVSPDAKVRESIPPGGRDLCHASPRVHPACRRRASRRVGSYAGARHRAAREVHRVSDRSTHEERTPAMQLDQILPKPLPRQLPRERHGYRLRCSASSAYRRS